MEPSESKEKGTEEPTSQTDAEDNYVRPRPVMVSTGVNTTPRNTRIDTDDQVLSDSNRSVTRFSGPDEYELDMDETELRDSITSDHSSVTSSSASFTHQHAKEGCVEGLMGFIVTAVSMLLLIMISWFLISQLDFCLECFTKISWMLYKTFGNILVFQVDGRPKHLRRKLSLYAEKED